MSIGGKLVAFILGAAGGGFVGYMIGQSKVPRNAELESAVYPGSGAIVGVFVGVILVAILIAVNQKRGE